MEALASLSGRLRRMRNRTSGGGALVPTTSESRGTLLDRSDQPAQVGSVGADEEQHRSVEAVQEPSEALDQRLLLCLGPEGEVQGRGAADRDRAVLAEILVPITTGGVRRELEWGQGSTFAEPGG